MYFGRKINREENFTFIVLPSWVQGRILRFTGGKITNKPGLWRVHITMILRKFPAKHISCS